MGGTIAVTLRDLDGNMHKMARWTNPLPAFVGCREFIEKDRAHVDEWMKQWHEMRADYLKHEVDQKFEHNMTPCYGDHVYLAPTGYGLVFIDMIGNRVFHAQGYTDFTKVYPTYLEDRDRIRALRRGDHLACLKMEGVDEAIDVHGLSIDGLFKLWDAWQKAGIWAYFEIDYTPFEIVRFEESADGFRIMREAIIDAGFTLTEREEELWRERIAHEEEIEDGR